MGTLRGRLVTGRTCQRRYRTSVPPQPLTGPSPRAITPPRDPVHGPTAPRRPRSRHGRGLPRRPQCRVCLSRSAGPDAAAHPRPTPPPFAPAPGRRMPASHPARHQAPASHDTSSGCVLKLPDASGRARPHPARQPDSGITHPARRTPGIPPPDSGRPAQAAPRWSASHTAVDSRTPSSTERPQWVIQAAIPSGVPAV